MVVYCKNNKWYFNLMIRGKRYHRAIPEATSKKQAEAAQTIIKSQLLQGRFDLVENKKSISFKKLLEIYDEYAKSNKLGWKEEQSKIKKLTEFFGNFNIDEINPFLVEQYRSKRKKTPKKNQKPLSNASINRETSILSKMLSIAVNNGWIDSNPCHGVKKLREDTLIERCLQPDEEERLLSHCIGNQEYMKPILIMALHTAMRRGEILNLRWECVNLNQGYITVTKTKSGKDRKIPISPVLMQYLKELYKNRISEFVFTNPITGKPYNTIRKSFVVLCQKANITNLHFHCLRHTAATRMVASGIELVIVQEILGHSVITTTMRYSHPIPERKKLAIEALASFNEHENDKLRILVQMHK